MAKLPYLPLDAQEFILDEKLERLREWDDYRYLGILITIWAHLWLNPVKRGHFLELFNGKIQAVPDEIIAKKLHLTPQQWAETKRKLTKEIPLLKLGKHLEVHSKRQSKFKTKYEIYGDYTGKIPERNRKDSRRRLEENIIRSKRGIELELEVEEEYFGDLIQTFPGIDHEQELLNADAWHKSQPKEKKKKNHHAFLRNWFQKSYQDKQKGSQNARKSEPSKYPERTPLS